MNRLTSVSFAPLPSKVGDADSRTGKHEVLELFEKAIENWR